MMLTIVANVRRHSDYCELQRVQQDNEGGCRLQTLAIHGRHAVRNTLTPGTRTSPKENTAVHVLRRPQKTCESADRELLWKVQARAGVPDEVTTVIRQLHNGDTSPSLREWQIILGLVRIYTQGLRQGCLTFTTLTFSIFFFAAALVLVILERSVQQGRFHPISSLVDGALERTAGRGGQKGGGAHVVPGSSKIIRS